MGECDICEARMQEWLNAFVEEDFECYAEQPDGHFIKLQGGTLDIGIWCHHNNGETYE